MENVNVPNSLRACIIYHVNNVVGPTYILNFSSDSDSAGKAMLQTTEVYTHDVCWCYQIEPAITNDVDVCMLEYALCSHYPFQWA